MSVVYDGQLSMQDIKTGGTVYAEKVIVSIGKHMSFSFLISQYWYIEKVQTGGHEF